jgi:hypothetical protein
MEKDVMLLRSNRGFDKFSQYFAEAKEGKMFPRCTKLKAQ